MKLMLFTAPGCAPCDAIKPHVMRAAAALMAKHEEIDCTRRQARANKYHVQSTPTLLVQIDSGAIIHVPPDKTTAREIINYVKEVSR